MVGWNESEISLAGCWYFASVEDKFRVNYLICARWGPVAWGRVGELYPRNLRSPLKETEEDWHGSEKVWSQLDKNK